MNRRAKKTKRQKQVQEPKSDGCAQLPPDDRRLNVSKFKQWELSAKQRLDLTNDACQLGWNIRMCRGLEFSFKVTPESDRQMAFAKRCNECFIGGDIDIALIKLVKLLSERHVVNYSNAGPVDMGTCYNEKNINRVLTELVNLQLLFHSSRTPCTCFTNGPNRPHETNPVEVLIEVMRAFDWTVRNIFENTHKTPDYWRDEILAGRANFSPNNNERMKIVELHRHFGYNGNRQNPTFNSIDKISSLHKFGFHIYKRKGKSSNEIVLILTTRNTP